MSPRTLLSMIQHSPVFPPATVAFERSLSKQHMWSKERAWYRSQKEHWLGWLEEYEGPGYYGRKNWLRTAEFIYNHLVCPPMLLWIAEAAGVPKQTLRKAVRAALSAAPHLPTKSSAIRRVISWKQIEPLLKASFPGAPVRNSTQMSRPQPFPEEALDRKGSGHVFKCRRNVAPRAKFKAVHSQRSRGRRSHSRIASPADGRPSFPMG